MTTSDPRPGDDRRRFLHKAGIAAGAAWAAPTILSVTPASAGAASGDPCALQVTFSGATCDPFSYSLAVAVDKTVCPAGAPTEFALSVDGGPFTTVICVPLATSFSATGPFAAETSGQIRFQRLDACGGTVLQTLLSPVGGPCPPPGAEPGGPSGNGAPAEGEVRYTTADGEEHVVPL